MEKGIVLRNWITGFCLTSAKKWIRSDEWLAKFVLTSQKMDQKGQMDNGILFDEGQIMDRKII